MGDNFKGWTETTVGDFSPFLYGKGLAERQRNQLGSVPVFGSNGVIGTHTEALVNNAGIVIGRKGTVGAVHFCKGPFWPIDTAFYVESKPDREIRYIYYLLRSLGLEHMNADSAVPGLNRVAAHSRKILIPPLTEQKAIASILGALDDKIELNRKMNETLEAMARALFKSWFVDFDPIPGLGPHKEWQDSPLGRIPKGWRVRKIRECCSRVENGGTPRREEPEYWKSATIPWLTSGEVRQSIVAITENMISEQGLANSSAKLWPKGTTVVALYGATAGQVCFLANEMCANQACCGLVPVQNMQFFNYLNASSSVKQLEQQARGSAQQNLSQQIVADLPVIIPDAAVLNRFEEVVKPLFEKWILHIEQSRTLASIRDALLPKLLSGEIRIKDAERFVEEKI